MDIHLTVGWGNPNSTMWCRPVVPEELRSFPIVIMKRSALPLASGLYVVTNMLYTHSFSIIIKFLTLKWWIIVTLELVLGSPCSEKTLSILGITLLL